MNRADALRRNRQFRHIPEWSWREDRLVNRYARALIRGDYHNSADLMPDYRRELELLRAEHPDERWAGFVRSERANRKRVCDRATDLGGRWSGTPWTKPEERLARRFAREFLDGRYPDALKAARACRVALESLAQTDPEAKWLSIRRPLSGVHFRVEYWARKLGWTHLPNWWHPRESHMLKVHARGVVSGRYASVRTAARALFQRMNSLRRAQPSPAWLVVPRTEGAIYNRMFELVHAMGRRRINKWSKAESRRVDRFIRMLVNGRYRSSAEAGRALARELAGRFTAGPGGARRTVHAMMMRIQRRARARGLLWNHTAWTKGEKQILEGYARRIVRGEFTSGVHAARACQHELARIYQRDLTDDAEFARSSFKRPLPSIAHRLSQLSLAMGRPRANTAWKLHEGRIADRWSKYYESRRHEYQVYTYDMAGRSLKADLERSGFRRPLWGCIAMLKKSCTHHRAPRRPGQ